MDFNEKIEANQFTVGGIIVAINNNKNGMIVTVRSVKLLNDGKKEINYPKIHWNDAESTKIKMFNLYDRVLVQGHVASETITNDEKTFDVQYLCGDDIKAASFISDNDFDRVELSGEVVNIRVPSKKIAIVTLKVSDDNGDYNISVSAFGNPVDFVSKQLKEKDYVKVVAAAQTRRIESKTRPGFMVDRETYAILEIYKVDDI